MSKREITRVILIVLDGVGVGASPDAGLYGDLGSNSVGNTAKVLGGLDLPNLESLGLGNITDIQGVAPRKNTVGAYGKMQEKSAGKDTITGHWEMVGVYLSEPMPTFPKGFPQKIISKFEDVTGFGVIGNRPASGTVIIEELGKEHLETGKLIIYTSADSVFQIAAHEEIVPVESLYELCQKARDLLVGENAVARVIARPFRGEPGSFWRTEGRRDFSLEPTEPTVLDKLVSTGLDVFSVGKIDQIFNMRGITHANHTVANRDSIEAMKKYLEIDFSGLLFVNLVEFDMIYGHRNDPKGYAAALAEFDREIPSLQKLMRPGDLTLIVGDHGVDPTTLSTDHSREYVPLLVFGESINGGVNLGVRSTFSDVGATIADIFDLDPPMIGVSFLPDIFED